MFKSFFRTIFRGFFYTFGKFLFWALLGFLIAKVGGLLTISNAYALQNWTYDVPNNGSIRNYGTTYQNAFTGYLDYDKMTIGNATYLSLDYVKSTTSKDIYIMDTVPGFEKDHTYFYQMWYCFSTDVSPVTAGLLLINNATNNQSNRTFNYYGVMNLDDNDYLTADGKQYSHYSCSMQYYSFNYTGSTTTDGNTNNYLIARVSTSKSSSKRMVFYGSKLTDMGISTSFFTQQLDSINKSLVNSQNSQTTMKEEIIDNQNSNSQEIIDNANKNHEEMKDIYTNETENSDGTCSGVLCNLKKVVKGVINLPQTILNAIINALKSLFIPENTDFITNFVDSIENKLGFIASVPGQLIQFLLDLGTSSWDEVTTLEFPEIEMFGVCFWKGMVIDLSPALGIINTFKHFTDLTCVVLVCRTLLKWWQNFTGGDGS